MSWPAPDPYARRQPSSASTRPPSGAAASSTACNSLDWTCYRTPVGAPTAPGSAPRAPWGQAGGYQNEMLLLFVASFRTQPEPMERTPGRNSELFCRSFARLAGRRVDLDSSPTALSLSRGTSMHASRRAVYPKGTDRRLSVSYLRRLLRFRTRPCSLKPPGWLRR